MIVSLIAAASENNVIGRQGRLPWHLPSDMKHFRELTAGHPVIMGRKTYESIGRPLPKRRNIVVSHRKDLQIEGCEVVGSVDGALALASNFQLPTSSTSEIFVIGGGEIYRQALARADRIYLTRVHTTIDGDALFPEIDRKEWKEVSREDHSADQEDAVAYTFLTYDRVRS